MSSKRGLCPSVLAATFLKDDGKKNNNGKRGSNSNYGNSSSRQQIRTSQNAAGRPNSSTAVGRSKVIQVRAAHLPSQDGKSHNDSNTGNYDDGGSDDLWSEDLIPLIPIQPPSNVNNTVNRKVVHVPKRLMACDSWRILGDLGKQRLYHVRVFAFFLVYCSDRCLTSKFIFATMNAPKLINEPIVEAITSETSSKASSSASGKASSNSINLNAAATPVDITIISNDVAFFTDINIDSHKRALARVWERLRSKFHSNLICSISIIVFESKIAALDRPNEITSAATKDSIREPVINTTSNNKVMDPATPHPFKVAYCVQEIQNHIIKLSEKEYKQQGRNVATESKKNGMPMNIQLELCDFHPILFTSILQKWSRDILSSAASDSCRICFELPETFDGTQSAVTLDLSYSILPY